LFSFSGINKNTFTEWCRIDDEEEIFITAPRLSGFATKTTDEDNETLREVALASNWSNYSELRATQELRDNENIRSVTDQTLRKILKNQGF
jgi:hypothetical protein